METVLIYLLSLLALQATALPRRERAEIASHWEQRAAEYGKYGEAIGRCYRKYVEELARIQGEPEIEVRKCRDDTDENSSCSENAEKTLRKCISDVIAKTGKEIAKQEDEFQEFGEYSEQRRPNERTLLKPILETLVPTLLPPHSSTAELKPNPEETTAASHLLPILPNLISTLMPPHRPAAEPQRNSEEATFASEKQPSSVEITAVFQQSKPGQTISASEQTLEETANKFESEVTTSVKEETIQAVQKPEIVLEPEIVLKPEIEAYGELKTESVPKMRQI